MTRVSHCSAPDRFFAPRLALAAMAPQDDGTQTLAPRVFNR